MRLAQGQRAGKQEQLCLRPQSRCWHSQEQKSRSQVLIRCLQPEPDHLLSHGVAQPRGDYPLATKGTRHRWEHPEQPQSQPNPSRGRATARALTGFGYSLSNAPDKHKDKAVQTPHAFLQLTFGQGTEPWGQRLTGASR